MSGNNGLAGDALSRVALKEKGGTLCLKKRLLLMSVINPWLRKGQVELYCVTFLIIMIVTDAWAMV